MGAKKPGIRSIRVPVGLRATLYRDAECKTPANPLALLGSRRNLASLGYQDNVHLGVAYTY